MLRYYLFQYPYQILLIPPVVVWLLLNLKLDRQWRGLLRVSVTVALAIAGVLYVAGVPSMVRHDWCANRLALPISWALGHPLYYPPGEGPILTRIYGPVTSIAYLPTALTPTPTWAMLLGATINLLLLAIPAVLIIRWAMRGQDRLLMLGAMGLVAIVAMRNPVLSYGVQMVTTDAPAIGLAALAGLVLMGSGQRNPWRVGLVVGLLAGGAVWARQTFVPIIPALLVYAWMIGGTRWAVRVALTMGAVGITMSLVMIASFGWENLYYNLYELPAARPWRLNVLEGFAPIRRAIGWIWRDTMPIGWMLIAALLLGWNVPRSASDGLRGWADRNPWLLPLLMTIALLPTSAYAYALAGGESNNAAACAYFALLSAAIALGRAWGPLQSEVLNFLPRLIRLTMFGLLVGFCISWPADVLNRLKAIRNWPAIFQNNNEVAYQASKESPGELFFPEYPLAAMFAEGKVYHHDDGLYALSLVGRLPATEHFRAHLPERLRAVVVPMDPTLSPALSQMPDFKHVTPWPRATGWLMVTATDQAP